MFQSPIALLVTLAWIPTVLLLFKRLPAQQAIVLSFLTAWLFLPAIQYPLPAIPDLTKMSATCYSILLATFIYDVGRFRSFKPGWIDLPMLIWCLCPIASAITNGLELYDGISAASEQIVTWGLPYFLGRLYLNNLTGLSQLAKGIFIGGLFYIPLCFVEMAISPQLHKMIYGFYAHSSGISQAMRYGGWRPMVFMEHGLMLGVWMMSATLIGLWLWTTGVIKQVWGFPIRWLMAVLIITFVLAKSTGAYGLLVLGVIILFLGKWLRVALPLLLLIAVISSYLYLGVSGTFSSGQIVSVATEVVGPERAESLQFRFINEEDLIVKARRRMIFGWGGWGRNQVVRYKLVDNEIFETMSITDSLWIIAFGSNGVVGLSSLIASLLLPVCWFVLRYPANYWSHRQVAPAAVLAVLLALYTLDCVLNAMVNPIFAIISGGLSGLVLEGAGSEPESDRTLAVRNYLAQSRSHLPR